MDIVFKLALSADVGHDEETGMEILQFIELREKRQGTELWRGGVWVADFSVGLFQCAMRVFEDVGVKTRFSDGEAEGAEVSRAASRGSSRLA